LKGLVDPSSIVLAGSAIGRISQKQQRIVGDVCNGDAIVFIASSGIHANGITLCRNVAANVTDGYLAELLNGETFGQAILVPTHIYVDLIRACLQQDLIPHYAVNITGHGWRKLMRLRDPFVYRIHQPPICAPIFSFLIERAGLSLREAYATFNMGVGFAVYTAEEDAERCVAISKAAGFDAWIAGTVEKQGGRKAVEIMSHDIVFEEETLHVRA